MVALKSVLSTTKLHPREYQRESIHFTRINIENRRSYMIGLIDLARWDYPFTKGAFIKRELKLSSQQRRRR